MGLNRGFIHIIDVIPVWISLFNCIMLLSFFVLIRLINTHNCQKAYGCVLYNLDQT